MSRNTLALFAVATLCLLTFGTFFCFAFPVVQALHGFSVPRVIVQPSAAAVFLVFSYPGCAKQS
jgi:hypothetical protein